MPYLLLLQSKVIGESGMPFEIPHFLATGKLESYVT